MKFPLYALLLISILLMGCSKLNVANYDRLRTGLPYEEVVNILGSPTACDEVLGIKSCKWGDEKHHIQVSFVGGKVMLTSAENIR